MKNFFFVTFLIFTISACSTSNKQKAENPERTPATQLVCTDIYSTTSPFQKSNEHFEIEKKRSFDQLINEAKAMNPQQIKREQDKQMERVLSVRGGKLYTSRLHWKKRLQLQSKKNATRILEMTKSTANMPKHLQQNIDNLKLEFLHNSMTNIEEATPLLSSAAIGMGRNQRLFNVDILKTEGQVYGLINFIRIQVDGKIIGGSGRLNIDTPPNVYGHIHHFLRTENVRQNGWISMFVMDPTELLFTAPLLSETEKTNFIKKFAQAMQDKFTFEESQHILDNGPFDINSLTTKLRAEFYKKHRFGQNTDLSYFKPLIQKQHLFDFTVDDFEILIKKLLARYITKLCEQNLCAEAEKKLLEEPDILISEMLSNFNLPQTWEFKYPYRIEAHDWTPNRLDLYEPNQP